MHVSKSRSLPCFIAKIEDSLCKMKNCWRGMSLSGGSSSPFLHLALSIHRPHCVPSFLLTSVSTLTLNLSNTAAFQRIKNPVRKCIFESVHMQKILHIMHCPLVSDSKLYVCYSIGSQSFTLKAPVFWSKNKLSPHRTHLDKVHISVDCFHLPKSQNNRHAYTCS